MPGTIRSANGVTYLCNGLTGSWDIVEVPHRPPPTAGLRGPLGPATPGSLLPDAPHAGPAPLRAGMVVQP